MAEVTRWLRQRQHPVVVRKPVATGAAWSHGRWVSDDTSRLAQAAGVSEEEWPRITPWIFRDAVAPSVAARREGVWLNLNAIVAAVENGRTRKEALLVEGVGGLLCPITQDATIADLARALQFPLVVVTRRALGTLNHTLLTLEVARSRHLDIAGIVVNETEPCGTVAAQTNVEELRRWTQVPILAVVPHCPGGQGNARLLEISELPLGEVDWWKLGFDRRSEELSVPCRR
jgi:dethiobiotin synthetase